MNPGFPPFNILFEDDALVVINKPPGILVHRTPLSEDKVFVLQLLRDQLGGQHIYPAHRLDRATSGVLVFAKNPETASWLGIHLQDFKWEKEYLALVRGFMSEKKGVIDYPLADPESGKDDPLPAQTRYEVITEAEQPWPIGLRYPAARFSLIKIFPETGRRQQIRKHFAHLRHPIINDSRHGDVKFKRWFREHEFPMRLMLHARKMSFPHPATNEILSVTAPFDQDFLEICQKVQITP